MKSHADPAACGPSPAESKVSRGPCRLCFEEEGDDLIAPCACKGTSKWIHRSCLNTWRVSGSNPRALTNCCECGFQYRLQLRRVYNSEGEERFRHFIRKIAGQTLLCVVGVQLIIVALGMLVRCIDEKEYLVQFFGFPQDPGHEEPGDFVHALKHHKTTYYSAGLIVFLVLIGLISGCATCLYHVCPPRQRQTRQDCAHECTFCCMDCGNACSEFAFHLCMCRVCLSDTPCVGAYGVEGCDLASMGSGDGGGEACIGCVLCILVVGFIVLVVVGLFMAIVAVVMSAQRALHHLLKLQQMRLLAEEYVVEDLDPVGGPRPRGGASLEQEEDPVAGTTANESTRRQVEKDLRELFGGREVPAHTASSYGSVAETA